MECGPLSKVNLQNTVLKNLYIVEKVSVYSCLHRFYNMCEFSRSASDMRLRRYLELLVYPTGHSFYELCRHVWFGNGSTGCEVAVGDRALTSADSSDCWVRGDGRSTG